MASPTTPSSQPRGAHHLFAHRGLPHTFLRNPPGIMEILASTDALRFLQGMWGVVQAELPDEERVAGDGLAIEVFSVEANAHAAVVTMPSPEREFEAFFVGLVARLEGDDAFARVFSLVLASPPGEDPEAAMLEWNANGQHEFIEQRADVDPGAFVDAVEKVLASSSAG